MSDSLHRQWCSRKLGAFRGRQDVDSCGPGWLNPWRCQHCWQSSLLVMDLTVWACFLTCNVGNLVYLWGLLWNLHGAVGSDLSIDGCIASINVFDVFERRNLSRWSLELRHRGYAMKRLCVSLTLCAFDYLLDAIACKENGPIMVWDL